MSEIIAFAIFEWNFRHCLCFVVAAKAIMQWWNWDIADGWVDVTSTFSQEKSFPKGKNSIQYLGIFPCPETAHDAQTSQVVAVLCNTCLRCHRGSETGRRVRIPLLTLFLT